MPYHYKPKKGKKKKRGKKRKKKMERHGCKKNKENAFY